MMTSRARHEVLAWSIGSSFVTITGLPPEDPEDDTDDENEEDEDDDSAKDYSPYFRKWRQRLCN